MTLRALVADDYQAILYQLETKLKNHGFEVFCAEDGQEAIEIFEREIEQGNKFDLIVVDYMMPNVKGDAVINHFSEVLNERGQKMPPTFLLTGSNDGNLIPRARATGFAEILLKPDGVQVLMDRIEGKPLITVAA